MRHQYIYLCLVLLVCSSCYGEPSPGLLRVTWEVGTLGCRQAGVETIYAQLYGYSSAEPFYEGTAECEADRLEITAVSPDDYTLVLEGLDADGCRTHLTRRNVKVLEGQIRSLDGLSLVPVQRPIEFSWTFDTAPWCPCVGNEQIEFEMNLPGGEKRFIPTLCNDCQTIIREDFPLIDGLNFTVRAYNEDGQAYAAGSLRPSRDDFLVSPCEEFIQLEVELTTCEYLGCGER